MYAHSITTSPKQAKGNQLVHEGKVTRQSERRYFVASSTGNGGYVVDMRRRVCECADYRQHQEDCKHILAAEVYERLATEQEAARTARQQEQTARAEFRMRVNARITANKAAF